MILHIGLAMALIVVLNWITMIYEVIKHTPNIKDDDVTANDIIHNFMKNTDLRTIQRLEVLVQINKFLGPGAFVLIAYALLVL